MKINVSNGKGVTTNSVGKSHDFGIKDASMVIEILRNRLYANPIQTLTQEYICNARDAHRECGKSDIPIEITLPSSNNLTLKIKDYGPGLSEARVADVFVNYGTSSKRANNNQTGGFGIGAKSAWAYTDSFTIVTRVSGTEYHYVAHVGTKATGVLDLISEVKTKEANGTEIHIAIKRGDLHHFHNAVKRATTHWAIKPKIISNEAFNYEVYALDYGMVKFTSNDIYYSTRLTAVVDGVPYELTNTLQDNIDFKYMIRTACYIEVPNGELEVSASREALSDNAANRAKVKAILEREAKHIETKIKADLKSAASLGDCLDRFASISKHVYINFDATYGAYTIDKQGLIIDGLPKDTQLFEVSYRQSRRNGGNSLKIDYENMILRRPFTSTRFYMDTMDISKVSVQRRLDLYRQANDYKDASLLQGDLNNPKFLALVRDLNAIPVSTLPEPVIKRAAKRSFKDVVVATFYSCSTRRYDTSTVEKTIPSDTKETHVYIVKKQGEYREQVKAYKSLAVSIGEEVKVILVAEPQLKKMTSKSFVSIESFFKNLDLYLSKKFVNSLRAQIIARAVSEHRLELGGKNMRKKLGALTSKLDDKELGYQLTQINSIEDNNDYNLTLPKECIELLTKDAEIAKTIAMVREYEAKLNNEYPLLKSINEFLVVNEEKGQVILEEFVWYVNGKYAANKSKK